MGDSNSDSEVEENLGILQPTILQQIKKILEEYRNDIQIIKELIQNADDAGASQVKILYQGNQINREIPDEKKFRKFLRAPALVCYNDSVFDDEDWIGVRSIYTSCKAHDPLKIGRFGLGFKSIFHLTDCPTILSGDKVMFINPSESEQNKVCTLIKLRQLKKSHNLTLSDFLSVLHDTFDFHEEMLDTGVYPATLFWFPLRQNMSDLSNIIYTESEVNALLESFINESERNVLFAKSVCKLQLFIDMPDSEKSDTSALNLGRKQRDIPIYHMSHGKHIPACTVVLDNEGNTITHEKKKMNQELALYGKTVPEISKHWTFDVFVTRELNLCDEEIKTSKSRWLIVNYLKGGQLSMRTQRLLLDEDLSYHPFVGLAARIIEDHRSIPDTDKGHAFCYQPLPKENRSLTGLPVHVNSFFALGNNRRQIKWEDTDESAVQTDKAIEWNHALVSEIFPHGYHLLHQEMIALSNVNGNTDDFVASVYNMVPNIENTEQRWKVLARAFLELSKNDKIFFTKNRYGKWLNIEDAILFSRKEDSSLKESVWNTIAELLTEDQIDLTFVPEYVSNSMSATADLKTVCPEYVGNHLMHYQTYRKMSGLQKEYLLQYIASKLPTSQFENLELLPVANGSYTSYAGKEKIFLETEDVVKLFPGMMSKFVSVDLLPETSAIIQGITETGSFRIQTLDAEGTASMLGLITKEAFGTECQLTLDGLEATKWKPWIEGIWKLIQSKYSGSISIFQSLPIFPSSFNPDWNTATQIKLCSLSSLLMYMPQCENEAQCEKVCHALELLSVKIISRVPEFICESFVEAYITDDTSLKLISLLERVGQNEIRNFNTRIQISQQQIFLEYLSLRLHTGLTGASVKVLEQLFLFRQIRSAKDENFCLVSIQSNCKVFRRRKFPVRFYTPIVTVDSDAEQMLAIKLGAKLLDDEFLTVHMFDYLSQYSSKERWDFIMWVFNNPLNMKNQEITARAKKIQFVESEDEKLDRPSAFFDPRDGLLSRLFKNKGLFPKHVHKDDTPTLQVLLHLGLRTRENVNFVDIKRLCNAQIKENVTIDEEKTGALLEFLNSFPSLISKTFLWKKQIICIQCIRPENYPENLVLKNCNSSRSRRSCSPSEVKSADYIYLIGSVYFTIDCQHIQVLAKQLGWSEPPDVSYVIKHFVNVVKSYTVKSKASYVLMITKIYEWLADLQSKGTDVVTLLQRQFSQENSFIWDGDRFVSTDEIYVESLDSDLELDMFISQLPLEMKHLSDFFIRLGCSRHQNLDVYVKALRRIKEKDKLSTSHRAMRQMAVSILNKLKEDYLEEVKGLDLYLPVSVHNSSELVMKHLRDCVYCEAFDPAKIEDEDADIFYVHPDVPISTAESLGVSSIRQQILSDTDVFDEWGQGEPLTVRIRNLISQSYEDGFSIVKELFQNADDAGASKFYIMYDERENTDSLTNLISDEMADCQGPAFWIFNDAEFTEKDFVSIRKLGVGNKQNEPEKIGKFGVGFCGVYNITDLPSLVSGTNLIIFDPNTMYLKKAMTTKGPGIRLDFKKQKNKIAMKAFCNQFVPYENVFGCKLHSQQDPYFPGTLFRLPLRRRPSDISDIIYTKTEANLFIEKIMNHSSNMFLFNQNIQSFKLFHLQKNDIDPSAAQLLFEVDAHKQIVHTTRTDSQAKSNSIVKYICDSYSARTVRNTPFRCLQELSISTNIYTENRTNGSTITWLVSWATGKDNSFLNISNRSLGALPLGSVAVPVRKCQEKKYTVLRFQELPEWFYQSGCYFCFLPTAHEHQFEFHINGKFNISADRKGIKTHFDDNKHTEESHWNMLLLQDAVVHAYVLLLENTTSCEGQTFYLWPETDHSDNDLANCFVKSFYSVVTSSTEYKILEHLGLRVGLSNSNFLHPDLRENEIGKTIINTLGKLSSGYIVDIPRNIYTLLHKANESTIQRLTVTPDDFLMLYFFPNLSSLHVTTHTEDRDTILLYAMQLKNGEVKEWLRSNKCIPSDTGKLKAAVELIDPTSQLSRLYPERAGYFPGKTFTDKNYLHNLLELGVRNDKLSDEMVLERASWIEKNNGSCTLCIKAMSLHLQSYLCRHISEHTRIFDKLRTLSFLPVMLKPDSWPFLWCADSLMCEKGYSCQQKLCSNHDMEKEPLILEKPLNLFTYNCAELVGCVSFVVDKEFYHKLENEERVPVAQIKDLLSCFGLHGSTDTEKLVDMVIKQILFILNMFDANKMKQMNKEIGRIVEAMYDFLERNISQSQAEIFGGKTVVWVGHNFVPSDRVSHDEIEGCQPYLYSLNHTSISRCPTLYRALGIPEHFHAKDVAMIIAKIKCEYGDASLDEVQVKVCVNLLQFLSVCFRRENITNVNDFLSKYKVQAIFAPNEYMVLRDCSEMCLDDSDKIEKTSHMIYIHDSIPRKLAQQFGVLSKQLYQLEESSEDVVDFYQDEPLVYRLRRLIDGYPCDTGIFKELLQNADDAGATEVVFINDLDTYRSINVPGENFALLQKPALCVYNDSSFSKSDLDGIVKLGCGSKWDDPTKTGKFGVGFNSVYNVTDAPSFFTKGNEIENGETLCVFDPLAQHIPNVSKEKPGKRFINMSLIRDSQQDMMLGYHENKFFKDKSYGTIFRLPLRTKPSDIKSEVIDVNDISALLQTFYKELANVMIFLKNIMKIKILTHHEGTYDENVSVELHIQGNGLETRKLFSETLSRVHTAFRQQVSDVLEIKQESAEYEFVVEQYGKDVDQTKSKYYVVQTIGFSEYCRIPEIVQNAYKRGSIQLFPHGGVALCDLETRSSKGKAFCGLPLPGDTGLPVHVHGIFALDHETRRTLWKSDEIENCYKCQWNIALLKYVISHSYTLLLQRMKRKLFESYADNFILMENVKKALKLYFSYFPNPSDVHDLYWKKLTEFLHELILQNSLTLLPCLYHTEDVVKEQKIRVQWTAPRVKDEHFLAFNVSEYFLNKNLLLIKTLRSVGMTVVSVPEFVENSLKFEESRLKPISPKNVLEFLLSFDKGMKGGCTVCTGTCVRETSFETIEGIQAVFKFCIKDEHSFFKVINEMPLMLTQDGILNCMKSTVSNLFVTNFTEFFPSQTNKFVHRCLTEQVLDVHDKDMNDFVKLSEGRLKRFTLSDFVECVHTSGQNGLLAKPYIQWTKTDIQKEFISTFWDFFREQARRQAIKEIDKTSKTSGHIKTKAAVTHCLDCLGSLALLPAYYENTQEKLLVSVDEIYRLIDTDSFTQGSKLHETVVKLNLLQLDKTAFNCHYYEEPSVELVRKHVSNFQQPEMVLRCLCINATRIRRLQLTHDDANVLLRYFQNNIMIFKEETNRVRIKKLPIFITQTHEITDISNTADVFIVPKGLPTQGLQEVSKKRNLMLLQDIDLTDLYQFLNIKPLAIDQVYIKVLFPHIKYLTQTQVYIHIDFICRSILSKEIPDEMPLLDVLKDLPFVDTGKDTCMCIKDLFYDTPLRYKGHDISSFFRTMCAKSEMLPSQLQETHHIEIFKRLGLQYEMSAELFERFAQDIENEGLINITQRVRQRSDMLIKRFFKSHNVAFSSKFTAIKFIVPMAIGTELVNIHPQYNREHLISFRKSVAHSEKNVHACWTTSNILPDDADPRNYNKTGFIGRLGIMQKPSDEDVFRHCENIGKSLSRLKIQPFYKLDVAEVMRDIYESLAERQVPSYLKLVPLIYFPDLKRIAVASKVVINCTASQECLHISKKHQLSTASTIVCSRH